MTAGVLGYGKLVADQMLHVRANPHSDVLDRERYRLVGKPVPRVDIPGKVTGGKAYSRKLSVRAMAEPSGKQQVKRPA
jgi:nicotinate dehydrogenase subunit B